MKNLAILILVLVFALTACVEQNKQHESNSTTQNALLPGNLVVNYYIPLNADSIYHYNVSTNQDTGLNLVEFIFDKVLKGEIQAYESSDLPIYKGISKQNKLSVDDVKSKLGLVEETIDIEEADGTITSKVLISEFVPEEIIEIGFKEEWLLQDQGFDFSKKIFAYSFVREYLKSEPNNFRKVELFTIYPKVDSIIKPNWEYIGTKAREVYISAANFSDMQELSDFDYKNSIAGNSVFNDRNPFWNSYAYNKLVNSLFESAKIGQFSMIDFHSGDSLSYNDVELRMGVMEKNISYTDENGNGVFQKIRYDADLNQIKALIFVEEWYFDTVSQALKKEIKGIAPVRYHYTENGDELRKVIVFLAEF